MEEGLVDVTGFLALSNATTSLAKIRVPSIHPRPSQIDAAQADIISCGQSVIRRF